MTDDLTAPTWPEAMPGAVACDGVRTHGGAFVSLRPFLAPWHLIPAEFRQEAKSP